MSAAFERKPAATDTMLVKMYVDYNDYHAEDFTLPNNNEENAGTLSKAELLIKDMKENIRGVSDGNDDNGEYGNDDDENSSDASDATNSLSSDDSEVENRTNNLFTKYNKHNGNTDNTDDGNDAESDAEATQ
jgi:hypothetical protein